MRGLQDALHVSGGSGPRRPGRVQSDVVFCVGKDVAGFFGLLAASPKWKPYLERCAGIPALPKERTIIAQELAAAVKGKDKAVGWCGSREHLSRPT